MKTQAVPVSRLALLALFACAMPAGAEIYKFVDDKGQVTYTNMPRAGAKPQLVIPDLAPAATTTPTATKATKSRPTTKSPTPAYFPKVDVGTQRKRDDMRRQLLVEEMRSEERNLAAARGALAAGSRLPGTDIRKLSDAVRMHEKNIEMLNKELSHIR
jgi:hypothetical protein